MKSGWICKEIVENALLTCVEKHNLSPSEAQVVILMAYGMKPIKSSKILHKSPKTISAQKLTAYKKIGIKTDAELIHYLYWLREDMEQ